MAITPIPADSQMPGADAVGPALRRLFPAGYLPCLFADLPAAASFPGAQAVISNGDPGEDNGDAAVEDNSTGVTQLLFSNGADWLIVVGGTIPAG